METIPPNEWMKLVSAVQEIRNDVRELKEAALKKLLTPSEVQKMLEIGKSTYQRYVQQKIIVQTKIGGRAYVQRSDIEKLIEQGKM